MSAASPDVSKSSPTKSAFALSAEECLEYVKSPLFVAENQKLLSGAPVTPFAMSQVGTCLGMRGGSFLTVASNQKKAIASNSFTISHEGVRRLFNKPDIAAETADGVDDKASTEAASSAADEDSGAETPASHDRRPAPCGLVTPDPDKASPGPAAAAVNDEAATDGWFMVASFPSSLVNTRGFDISHLVQWRLLGDKAPLGPVMGHRVRNVHPAASGDICQVFRVHFPLADAVTDGLALRWVGHSRLPLKREDVKLYMVAPRAAVEHVGTDCLATATRHAPEPTGGLFAVQEWAAVAVSGDRFIGNGRGYSTNKSTTSAGSKRRSRPTAKVLDAAATAADSDDDDDNESMAVAAQSTPKPTPAAGQSTPTPKRVRRPDQRSLQRAVTNGLNMGTWLAKASPCCLSRAIRRGHAPSDEKGGTPDDSPLSRLGQLVRSAAAEIVAPAAKHAIERLRAPLQRALERKQKQAGKCPAAKEPRGIDPSLLDRAQAEFLKGNIDAGQRLLKEAQAQAADLAERQAEGQAEGQVACGFADRLDTWEAKVDAEIEAASPAGSSDPSDLSDAAIAAAVRGMDRVAGTIGGLLDHAKGPNVPSPAALKAFERARGMIGDVARVPEGNGDARAMPLTFSHLVQAGLVAVSIVGELALPGLSFVRMLAEAGRRCGHYKLFGAVLNAQAVGADWLQRCMEEDRTSPFTDALSSDPSFGAIEGTAYLREGLVDAGKGMDAMVPRLVVLNCVRRITDLAKALVRLRGLVVSGADPGTRHALGRVDEVKACVLQLTVAFEGTSAAQAAGCGPELCSLQALAAMELPPRYTGTTAIAERRRVAALLLPIGVTTALRILDIDEHGADADRVALTRAQLAPVACTQMQRTWGCMVERLAGTKTIEGFEEVEACLAKLEAEASASD